MGRDWRWLTKYTPRTAAGREEILRGLAGEGGGLVVAMVFFAVGVPVLDALVGGWAWWPGKALVHLGAFVGILAATAAIERAAARRLRQRTGRPSTAS